MVEDSGQNYERIDIKFKGKIADIGFTREYVRRAYKKNRVIEITLEDGTHLRLDNWKEAVDELGPEPNVILDADNEFMNDWSALDRAKEKVDYITDKGFIGGAGAWGYSTHGDKIAEAFAPLNRGKTWPIHRGPYPPLNLWQKYIQESKDASGKIILCNELLIHDPENIHGWLHPGAPWQEVETYVKGALFAGANGVNVYCGTAKHSWFEFMGQLCKEFNP